MRTFATVLASLVVAGAAHAAPLNTTFNINLWFGTNPNPGDSTDPSQQALPTNTLTSTGTLINATYTGPLDFNIADQAHNFLDEFIPGIGLPHQLISSAPFADTTVFEFTWVQPTTSGGTVSHDDGVSLFDITTNSGNLIPGNSAPTALDVTTLPTLIAGDNYELWYVEANGAPSVLTLNLTSVPEPGALGVLGLGLVGLGFFVRRRAG